MVSLVNVMILLVLAMVLFFAVLAIIRGSKGMKASKSFDTTDKRIKVAYGLFSFIHMAGGILITLCYIIVGVLILISLLGM